MIHEMLLGAVIAILVAAWALTLHILRETAEDRLWWMREAETYRRECEALRAKRN